MHGTSKIQEVYLDILDFAKGKSLQAIADKHGVALSTLYLWKRKFRDLAGNIPVLMERNHGNDEKVGGEEQNRPDWKKPARKGTAGHAEDESNPPAKTPKGRQRDGCCSIPVVAKLVGKSENMVKRIIRDYNMKPDTILVKRAKASVPGYSEEDVERIKSYDPLTVDSVELRELFGIQPHTFQRFMKYIALFLNQPMMRVRFPEIIYALKQHKKSHTYKFKRTMIPDITLLYKVYRKENDGRKRGNRAMRAHLKSLASEKQTDVDA